MALPTPKVTLAGPKDCKLGVAPSSCHEMVCCWPAAQEVLATGEVTCSGEWVRYNAVHDKNSMIAYEESGLGRGSEGGESDGLELHDGRGREAREVRMKCEAIGLCR